jgi:hypothetical protein
MTELEKLAATVACMRNLGEGDRAVVALALAMRKVREGGPRAQQWAKVAGRCAQTLQALTPSGWLHDMLFEPPGQQQAPRRAFDWLANTVEARCARQRLLYEKRRRWLAKGRSWDGRTGGA